ncbi:hypothetical protein F5I97DRAFT_1849420 [Phlebopus sp. FC_14]|nr:hypothetical protein F5I97DRAFT_1849420 [Phlebopus sp. FC_14]
MLFVLAAAIRSSSSCLPPRTRAHSVPSGGHHGIVPSCAMLNGWTGPARCMVVASCTVPRVCSLWLGTCNCQKICRGRSELHERNCGAYPPYHKPASSKGKSRFGIRWYPSMYVPSDFPPGSTSELCLLAHRTSDGLGCEKSSIAVGTYHRIEDNATSNVVIRPWLLFLAFYPS